MTSYADSLMYAVYDGETRDQLSDAMSRRDARKWMSDASDAGDSPYAGRALSVQVADEPWPGQRGIAGLLDRNAHVR